MTRSEDSVTRSEAKALRKFKRWASAIKFVGKGLCRMETSPETLPDSGGRPIVMVANHRSLADVFISIDALNRYGEPARCLVRKNYFDIPVAGRWLRSVGCIPAGDGKGGAIEDAIETLASGRSIAVMAEGRITPPDQRDEQGLGVFRPGFIDIARTAGAVILPIAILGADDVWGSRSRLPRVPWRGRPVVKVTLGDTISIDDMTDEEALDAVRQAIARQLSDSQ